ncbi:hypothetical protein CC80DRAFT_538218, partial [Byssothecium circinans]
MSASQASSSSMPPPPTNQQPTAPNPPDVLLPDSVRATGQWIDVTDNDWSIPDPRFYLYYRIWCIYIPEHIRHKAKFGPGKENLKFCKHGVTSNGNVARACAADKQSGYKVWHLRCTIAGMSGEQASAFGGNGKALPEVVNQFHCIWWSAEERQINVRPGTISNDIAGSWMELFGLNCTENLYPCMYQSPTVMKSLRFVHRP